jgi:hypothetical protein
MSSDSSTLSAPAMTSASSSKSLSQLLGEVCETTDDSVASGMLVILEKLEKEVLGWGIGYEVSVRFICPFLQRQVLQGVVPGDLAGDLTGDLTGDLISPILTILPLSHLVNPLGRAPLGILGVALLEFETGFETGSSHLWRMYPFGTQSLAGPEGRKLYEDIWYLKNQKHLCQSLNLTVSAEGGAEVLS